MKNPRPGLLLAFVLLGFVPSASYACSCAATPPPREKFHKSALVFTGRVSSLQIDTRAKWYVAGTARVTVERVWKGKPPKTMIFYMAMGDCPPITFAKGRLYVFYLPLLRKGQRLAPTVCSWIHSGSRARADFKWLPKIKSRKA